MWNKMAKLLCALLLLLNLVLLFLPYWTSGDTSISIGAYILKPYHYKSLTTALRDITGEKKLQTWVTLPLFAIMFMDTLGVIISAFCLKSNAAAIFCIVSGILSAAAFIFDPIVKGGNLFTLFVAVAVCSFLSGAGQLLLSRRRSSEA